MHGVGMAKRKKLRAAVTLAYTGERIHDRLSHDLPLNSVVAPVTIRDHEGDQIRVLRSLRDDPLAALFARQQIDDAQYLAGRKWQALFEMSGIGAVRAIDPTREAVDGGRMPEMLTEAHREAVKRMAVLGRALGLEGDALVRDVLGLGYSLEKAAIVRGTTSEREQRYLGRRLRECLDTLAIELGFAMTPKGGR